MFVETSEFAFQTGVKFTTQCIYFFGRICSVIANEIEERVVLEGRDGRGPITRALEGLASRAGSVAEGLAEGQQSYGGLMQAVANKRAAMEQGLQDESVSITQRRNALRVQDGEMRALLTQIEAAVPTSMAVSFAQELRAGITVPGRPEATAQINRTLAGYATAIEAALPENSGVPTAYPLFPSKTAIGDTLRHIDAFLPVAMLAIVIDLVLPLLLFAYTVKALRNARFPVNMDPRAQKRRVSDAEDLIGMHAFDKSEVPDWARTKRDERGYVAEEDDRFDANDADGAVVDEETDQVQSSQVPPTRGRPASRPSGKTKRGGRS